MIPVYPLFCMVGTILTMMCGMLFATNQGMTLHAIGFAAIAFLGCMTFYVLDWYYLYMNDAKICILATVTTVLTVASFSLDLMLPTIVIVALALFFLNVAGVRRGFRKDPS